MYYSCFSTQTEICFRNKPCCSFVFISGAYLRALSISMMESFKRKCKAVFDSRGCIGCCSKPPLITAVDNPSKGLRIQGRSVHKGSISDDFWSSSACEMENSIQSQRSISSISTSNIPLDPNSSTSSSMNNHGDFVNHGLLLWNQTRQQWVANKRQPTQTKDREPTISWNATYENFLGTNKLFPHAIPLPEMVDFLVDVWEQDGLYD